MLPADISRANAVACGKPLGGEFIARPLPHAHSVSCMLIPCPWLIPRLQISCACLCHSMKLQTVVIANQFQVYFCRFEYSPGSQVYAIHPSLTVFLNDPFFMVFYIFAGLAVADCTHAEAVGHRIAGCLVPAPQYMTVLSLIMLRCWPAYKAAPLAGVILG